MDKPKPFKLTPPDPSEDQFQQAVASLLDTILRPEEAIYTHIAHGGYELSKAARARLLRLGLKRGWPDLCIAYKPGKMLWLELKAPNGRLSLDQQQRHAQLFILGHTVVTLKWSSHWAEDVLSALSLYGVPFRRARLAEGYLGAATQAVTGTTQGEPAELPQGAA